MGQVYPCSGTCTPTPVLCMHAPHRLQPAQRARSCHNLIIKLVGTEGPAHRGGFLRGQKYLVRSKQHTSDSAALSSLYRTNSAGCQGSGSHHTSVGFCEAGGIPVSQIVAVCSSTFGSRHSSTPCLIKLPPFCVMQTCRHTPPTPTTP